MPAFQGRLIRVLNTWKLMCNSRRRPVAHDDRLDRVTNKVGKVSELSWAEVAALVDGQSQY